MASGKHLCHCLRFSPEDIFSDVFIVACVLSNTPIVYACFVVAGPSVTPRTSAISCIRLETKTEPSSVVITVGKYACFLMLSMIICTVLTVVGSDTGYAKVCFERTSIAAIIFSLPPLGGSSGSRSICLTSSGPESHSGILISCVVNSFLLESGLTLLYPFADVDRN